VYFESSLTKVYKEMVSHSLGQGCGIHDPGNQKKKNA